MPSFDETPEPSLTEFDYHQAAKSHEIIWLGPLPASSKEPTTWRCRRGHEWQASYVNTANSKPGCPKCAIEKWRNTDENYRQVGLLYNLLFIGPLPESTRAKTWWGCPFGHHFPKRLKSILSGDGCPTCAWLANNHNTEPHTLRLCDGQVFTLGTFVEAKHEKQYWDAVGCSPDCCKDHPLAKL